MTKKDLTHITAIVRHQWAVKRLVRAIEKDHPGLSETTDDPPTRWTWGMWVDQQGAVINEADAWEDLKVYIDRINKKKEGA